MRTLTTPIDDSVVKSLCAGDLLELSGTIYTARDAAHKRMWDALFDDSDAPFDYAGQVVFYAGPAPAPPGRPIGSVGPTTAGRMDAYAPDLIRAGLKIIIAKGNRNADVVEALRTCGGVYLAAVGGVAALMAGCVVSCVTVAYDDLGTEAIHRLVVHKMPLVVAIDSGGRGIYSRG